MKITTKKKDLQLLLLSLGKISDCCVLSLNSENMYAIASSDDNSMYVYASLKGDFEEFNLNLPSLKKLNRAIELIPTDDISLSVNNNNLEYKGNNIKFKYHLHDDGILTKPKLSIDKIRGFDYDIDFELDIQFLSSVLKNSAITTTDKLYIFTQDNHLVWKLGDETIANSDTLAMIGDEVDFELEPFILKIDNLKNIINISKESTRFKINSKLGVGNIVSVRDDLEINYIFSSLTK